jgi:hypothetical protein
MYLPQDRFVLHDPELEDYVYDSDGPLSSATLEEALQFAHWETQLLGHDLMVGDRMSHQGKTVWRRVSPSGEVTPQ